MNRFYKNCDYIEDFIFFTNRLVTVLMKQGYTRSVLRKLRNEIYILNNTESRNGKILKGFSTCPADLIDKCKICRLHANPCKFVKINNSLIDINQNMTCQTKNCIYVISCTRCPELFYIGETSNSARTRMQAHISNIKTRKNTTIAHHFNLQNHTSENLKFTVVLSNFNWSDSIRKNKESKMILKYNTKYPNGLNENEFLKKTQFMILPYKGYNTIPQNLRNADPSCKYAFKLGQKLSAHLRKV